MQILVFEMQMCMASKINFQHISIHFCTQASIHTTTFTKVHNFAVKKRNVWGGVEVEIHAEGDSVC